MEKCNFSVPIDYVMKFLSIRPNLEEIKKYTEYLRTMDISCTYDNVKIPLPVMIYHNPAYKPTMRLMSLRLFLRCMQHEETKKLNNQEFVGLILKIEDSLYKFTVKSMAKINVNNSFDNITFTNFYVLQRSRLLSNLDSTTDIVDNKTLIRRIISGEIDIDLLPEISSQELMPEKYNEFSERLKANKPNELKKTQMYRCYRCRGRNCSAVLCQLRSLDEGSNVCITCLDCGNQWNN